MEYISESHLKEMSIEQMVMKLLKALKWFWYELGIMGLLIDDYGDIEGAKKRRLELYKKQDDLKKK